MLDAPPYGPQRIDDDIGAVVDVLRSEYLTTGPATPVFEDALSQATRATYAVAFSSGSPALHPMYFAAGLRQGDEIITTPLTLTAKANADLCLGATVRFFDVQPDIGTLNPGKVREVINDRMKLIAPVGALTNATVTPS